MEKDELYRLTSAYIDGTASEEERQRLLSWYRAHDHSAVEWPADDPQEAAAVKLRLQRQLQAYAARPALLRRRRMLRIAAAACLLLAAGMIWLLAARQPAPVPYITVSNPAGRIMQVTLPDSSAVWLNAASTLRYPRVFAEDRREVMLEGEAFFDIRRQPEAPFTVHTGRLSTRVLGTSFNIKAYTGDANIAITVATGKIQVSDQQYTLGLLQPSQQMIYSTATARAEITDLPAAGAIAWKAGQLNFEAQTLESIAADLERWYNVKISFDNEGLKRCQYDARFDNNIALNDLLSRLCDINNIRFKIDEKTRSVVLSGKGCN